MRQQFQEELEAFYQQLTKIGSIANEALHKAIQSYDHLDKNLAQEIVDGDNQINKLVVDIELEAYRLIALQQPVAGDLRRIFTVLMASMDIERIADHAADIAKTVLRLDTSLVRVEAIRNDLNQMATIAQDMLKDVLDSFYNIDEKKIQAIANRDDHIDDLLKKLYTDTQISMTTNTEVVNPGINFLNIGKSIERIGDYTTNICERLVYMETGEVVELNR